MMWLVRPGARWLRLGSRGKLFYSQLSPGPSTQRHNGQRARSAKQGPRKYEILHVFDFGFCVSVPRGVKQ